MADIRYYVSQQNGNDANDGLTPATAWKTLTKAMQTVPTPSAGNNHYVHIGPGTYRERVIPTNSGYSESNPIIYAGDQNCIYLTSDTPGRVRITGCGTDELPTSGSVLAWTGKSFLELWDVDVDGSSDNYACGNIPVCKRVNATSFKGFYLSGNCACYKCNATATYYGFYTYGAGSSTYTNLYKCVALGGNYGFYLYTNSSSASVANYGFVRYCTVIGCNIGIQIASGASSSYGYQTIDHVSMIGNTQAFSSSYFRGIITNVFIIGSDNGYITHANCFNLISMCSGTNTVYYGKNAKFLYGKTSNDAQTVYPSPKHITLEISSMLPNFINLFGLNKYGEVCNPATGSNADNANYYSSYTMNMQSEMLCSFTPARTGNCVGAQLFISSLGADGSITIELQKYLNAEWYTQKSKTITVANLAAGTISGWNYFEWDTTSNDGDNALTATASTWRFRITASGGATSSIVYGTAATTPSVVGHYIPTEVMSDIEGNGVYGPTLQGAIDVPSIDLDLTTYQTNAPSIKFTGAGEKVLKLPVKKNVSVTISYQVQHSGAAAGKEPQIRLQHKDITTQTATHSAGQNAWQQLSATVTPAFDGVIDVVLASRDPLANAWFSDPSVT